jgi:Na+-driven multidrug efflux pump
LILLPPLIRSLATAGAAVSLVIAEASGTMLMASVIWRNRNAIGYQSIGKHSHLP